MPVDVRIAVDIGVAINIVLSLLAAVYLWRVSFRITWDKITE
jgi:hypothetical protein